MEPASEGDLGPREWGWMLGSPARVLLVAVLLSSSALPALGVEAPVDFHVETLKYEDGVPHGVVTGFAQDVDNYLWIISDQALARYDGVRFLSVDAHELLPDSAGYSGPWRPLGRLFSGRSGTVWLSTADGDLRRWNGEAFDLWFARGTARGGFVEVLEVSRDDILAVPRFGDIIRRNSSGRVETFRLENGPRLQPGTLFLDGEGRLWFLTASGTAGRASLDGHLDARLEHDAQRQTASALARDSLGNVWLGAESALWTWRSEGWQPVAPPAGRRSFPVRTIVPSPSGALWVSVEGRAWFWQADTWQGPVDEWPEGVSARGQLVDQADRLWLAPPAQGLWCLRAGEKTVKLGPEAGIVANVQALFCDRENNVWASLYRVGIVRIRSRRFMSVTAKLGLHTTPLWNVTQDAAGAIWLCPEFQGPIRWEDGNQAEFPFPGPEPNFPRWTKALTVSRSGEVYAAVPREGLLWFDGCGFTPAIPWPRGAGFPRVLYHDRAERWWLGTDNGLHRWAGGRWQAFGPAQRLPKAGVRAIVETTDGTLWVGTYGGGLGRLSDDRFTALQAPQGLLSDLVYTLYPGGDGSLWVGTEDGLGRYRGGRFTRYTSLDGLPDNRVVQIVEDDSGSLWLGTHEGLCRVSLRSVEAMDCGGRQGLDCAVFDQQDGLPSRAFQDRASPACWRARDGRLWFLTGGSAVYFHPAQIRRNEIAPPAVIESVLIDGKPVSSFAPAPAEGGREAASLAALDCRAPASVDLPPGPHVIELRYTAPSLTVPEKVRFEYQMEGLHPQWVQAGQERSARFNFLPPGRYRFRVRAANNDGKWNRQAAELAIMVRPHFWEARWFPALMALALAGSVGGAAVLLEHGRLRRQMARLEIQRAKDAERTRISRDLHDHLGASLTEIGMLAANGAQARAAATWASARADAIQDKVRSVVTELDAMVWAVNPKHDTLSSLASYLASVVEEFAAAAGLECRIDLPRPLADCPLASGVRHSLFLAVREAVNNAVSHAQPTEIAFALERTPSRLRLTVADDGTGFDPAVVHAGCGLTNLRERMTSLGGSCRIISLPCIGTTVVLECPLTDSETS
jgi:signal transduction histidine kinase/ligand-binding sensor domain-containing protein